MLLSHAVLIHFGKDKVRGTGEVKVYCLDEKHKSKYFDERNPDPLTVFQTNEQGSKFLSELPTFCFYKPPYFLSSIIKNGVNSSTGLFFPLQKNVFSLSFGSQYLK